jgi:hypothetical protein
MDDQEAQEYEMVTIEWSEQDAERFNRLGRRATIVTAVASVVTSAVVTTALFFGYSWVIGTG